MKEFSCTFKVGNDHLLGVIHPAQELNDTAVLMIVGGPQYRIGSHRQFLLLARKLASKGITSMRFDYRGMGDSEGAKQPFDDIDEDITAAISSLQENLPHIKKIILWGLCDAASAALIFARANMHIKGLVLLNPWLKNDRANGRIMLKNYYLRRLFSKKFWTKLISGNFKFIQSSKDVNQFIGKSFSEQSSTESSYQMSMSKGLQAFLGEICVIISGNDLTANEFEAQIKNNKSWRKLFNPSNEYHSLANADHTFSSMHEAEKVENITVDFAIKIQQGASID